MRKPNFLIGEWSGEASVARGPGIIAEVSQTEVAEFKVKLRDDGKSWGWGFCSWGNQYELYLADQRQRAMDRTC